MEAQYYGGTFSDREGPGIKCWEGREYLLLEWELTRRADIWFLIREDHGVSTEQAYAVDISIDVRELQAPLMGLKSFEECPQVKRTSVDAVH